MADAKIALVTGAYRGLGLETARQLGRKGYRVIVTARKPAAAKKAVASLTKDGIDAAFVELDVSDPESIGRAARQVHKDYGRLDVLVNNAAIVGDSGKSPITVDADDVRRAFETNTLGPLLVSQTFLPLLLKSKRPRIVNVSSGAGALSSTQAWAPAYSLSKTGLNSVTNQLAGALKDKVAVNSVCPGWVRTDMGGKEAPRSVSEGADGIVWLAADAPWDLTGGFFRDRQKVEW